MNLCATLDFFEDTRSAVQWPKLHGWSRAGFVNATRSFEDIRSSAELQEFVREIVDSCRESIDNGVLPDTSSVAQAVVLVARLLMARLPIPDPVVTDAGQIMLDWAEARSIFSAIINATEGRLHYAWIADKLDEKAHADVHYDSGQLPPKFVRALAEWSQAAKTSSTSSY